VDVEFWNIRVRRLVLSCLGRYLSSGIIDHVDTFHTPWLCESTMGLLAVK